MKHSNLTSITILLSLAALIAPVYADTDLDDVLNDGDSDSADQPLADECYSCDRVAHGQSFINDLLDNDEHDDDEEQGQWIDPPAGSFTVFQEKNAGPSVYGTNVPVVEAGTIEFTIRVDEHDTSNEYVDFDDNDFFGVVIGFEDGDFDNPDADYILIDWREESEQNELGHSEIGMAISRVRGAAEEADMWTHSGAVTTLSEHECIGWEHEVTYLFRLDYSAERIRLTVIELNEDGGEGERIFEFDIAAEDRPFPVGTLSFYNYSLAQVSYTLVSPRDYEVCVLQDSDDDGVADCNDICAGHDDALDSDNDGLADGCDTCQYDPNNDADNDGVCGVSEDNCPNVYNPDQRDSDGDGIGDACEDRSTVILPDPDTGKYESGPRISVAGGGCSATGHGSSGAGGFAILMLLAMTASLARRRRHGAL
ncbi:MAG: MYXO-CTERM sorting domain-containing protein [Myxococcota bacterium]